MRCHNLLFGAERETLMIYLLIDVKRNLLANIAYIDRPKSELLPTVCEVWGKVVFLPMFVCPPGGRKCGIEWEVWYRGGVV